MAHQETRKQQIARRLRVSERVLEQYLQLKRAEVEDEIGDPVVDTRAAPRAEQPLVEPRVSEPRIAEHGIAEPGVAEGQHPGRREKRL
jgi:hypothetical protein